MTLVHELDLGILKVYLHSKNEVCRSTLSKLEDERAAGHMQTDRRDRTHYRPRSWVIIIIFHKRRRHFSNKSEAVGLCLLCTVYSKR